MTINYIKNLTLSLPLTFSFVATFGPSQKLKKMHIVSPYENTTSAVEKQLKFDLTLLVWLEINTLDPQLIAK